MKNKMLRIGIISREDYKKRTLAVAGGKYKPKPEEPKIWFESLYSMCQILSSRNQELLRIILKEKPDSLKYLESVTGRKSRSLSRTLKQMERYGIVSLEKHSRSIRPRVKATDFRIEFGLNTSK